MSGSDQSYDVAVIGGGPAGAAAATVLARAGLRTVLVERSRHVAVAVGEGLPPAAKPLLQDLGVWDLMDADGHLRSYGHESAWGDATLRTTQFLNDPHGVGWHLDRLRFDALLRAAAERAGTSVKTSAALRTVVRRSQQWELALEANGRATSLASGWWIDCTGRPASAARSAGAVRCVVDRLVAFVRVYHPRADRVGADVDSMTLVESASDGWWYTSRLPSANRIVVYLTDADDDTAAVARTPDGFAALLDRTNHARARLTAGAYGEAGPPRIVAADTSRLDRMTGERWLAAGDAVTAFDPLSSQGILTALYSGSRAAEYLVAHLAGERAALGDYAARLESIFSAHLAHRREYYGQERRWMGHRFWRRRHESTDVRFDSSFPQR